MVENNTYKINLLILQIWILFSAIIFFIFFNNYEFEINKNILTILAFCYLFNIYFVAKLLNINTSHAMFWLMISFILYHILPILFYSFVNINNYINPNGRIVSLKWAPIIYIKTFLISVFGFQCTLLSYIFTKKY